jgi:formylmethanofuran dehydrogenase subunit E
LDKEENAGIVRRKREQKQQDKLETQSVKSGGSKYSNRAATVACDRCGKEMRSDKVREHRGGKFCKKKL